MQRLMLKAMNLVAMVICYIGIFGLITGGSGTLLNRIGHAAFLYLAYRIYRSSLVQSLLLSMFGWSPSGNIADASANMAGDAISNFLGGSGGPQAGRQDASQQAFNRWKANEEAAFHRYRAQQTQGTSDAGWHKSQEWAARDRAKRY